MHGDIHCDMHGDIHCDMHGDIHCNMHDDIHCDIYGDIHCDIYGDIHRDKDNSLITPCQYRRQQNKYHDPCYGILPTAAEEIINT